MNVTSRDSQLAQEERQQRVMVWQAIVARYQQPSLRRSISQIVNSVVPYAELWFSMDKDLALCGWLIMPLTILSGGFLSRIFIIHDDCGHGSFVLSIAPKSILTKLSCSVAIIVLQGRREESADPGDRSPYGLTQALHFLTGFG